MSFITSANPTVRRKEEAHLIRERLRQLDEKVSQLARAWTETTPAFTDAEVDEVGRLLVEGKVRLPTHVRLTVTTTVEDVRDKLFNTSAQLIKHEADQLHTKLLRPLTVLQALEAGLLVRLGSNWLWAQAAYERLAAAQCAKHG
jgi:hypothetical protein